MRPGDCDFITRPFSPARRLSPSPAWNSSASKTCTQNKNSAIRADMAAQSCTIRITNICCRVRVPVFNAFFSVINLCEYHHKSYIAENYSLGDIFVADGMGLTSTHRDLIGPQMSRFRRNSAKERPLCRPRTFKGQFRYQWKACMRLPCVNNGNWLKLSKWPILHRFRDWRIIGQLLPLRGGFLSLTHSLGWTHTLGRADFWPQETRNTSVIRCKAYFDILNRSGVTPKFDRRTYRLWLSSRAAKNYTLYTPWQNGSVSQYLACIEEFAMCAVENAPLAMLGRPNSV